MRHTVPESLKKFLPPGAKGLSLLDRLMACEMGLIEAFSRLSELELEDTYRKVENAEVGPLSPPEHGSDG